MQASRFEPTVQTIDPVDRPDHLTGAVLHSLGRRIGGVTFAWGVAVTMVLGVVSFGVLPVLIWTRQFRLFVVVEQQRLWHLAEWMRLRGRQEEAAGLVELAERMEYRAGLRVVSLMAVWGVAGMLLGFVWRWHPTLQQMLGMTYRYGADSAVWGMWETTKITAGMWTVGLTVAYACHWAQVRLHARDVRQFVERFNRLAQAEGVTPVDVPGTGLGLRPLWLAGAVGMLVMGAAWGVPMMLAGAVQRRYVVRASPRARIEMAQRVHAMLTRHRPAISVTTPASLQVTCGEEKCQAVLPDGAAYCPRCGRKCD